MKLAYRPFGLVFGILGGLIAGRLFKSMWRVVGGEHEAPKATDRDRHWSEVVAAAALEGAVFAGIKALVDRLGARGFEQLTGEWPGRTDSQHDDD